MGSPKKRRRRRAAASTLSISPDASGVFSAKQIAQMGSGEFIINAMRHSLRAKGKVLSPFTSGSGPDQAAIDAMLADSGMVARGLTKLSDLDLTGIARIELRKGGAIANNTELTIGTATFHFTSDGEASGAIFGAGADEGKIAVLIAGNNVQGDELITAMTAPAVQAAHPILKTITITKDVAAGAVNEPDLLYMETSLFTDIAVTKAGDGGSRLDIENIPGRQQALLVNHYHMDISTATANPAAAVVINADSGVLWLENGPGAKYIHGVDAATKDSVVLHILPDGFDAEADRGKRMIFKVVSGVFTGDLIKVEALTAADGSANSSMDNLSLDYDVLPSVTGKTGLDPAAGTSIDLGQHVLAADSDEAGNSNNHFGLRVVFNRGNDDDGADLGMGPGLAIAWRVVGS